MRRAESRRARCARGRRALVGDSSPSRAGSERGAHWSVRDSQIAKSNKKNTSRGLVDNKPCSGRHQRAGRRRSCCASKSRRPSSRIVSSSCALTDGSARLLAGSAITVDPRRPALRRTPPNHHAGASSQRVSRCTPDGQRAPMAAWARRAPWPACRYEAQLLGRGAP